MVNWKGFGRKRTQPNLRYYPSIYVGSEENHEKLSQNHRSPGRDLNPRPPEYVAGVLTTQSWRLVLSTCVCRNIPLSGKQYVQLCSSLRARNLWDFRFSRRRVWRWLASGMLCHVDWLNFTNVNLLNVGKLLHSATSQKTVVFSMEFHEKNDKIRILYTTYSLLAWFDDNFYII
jgi:hypothetical protein